MIRKPNIFAPLIVWLSFLVIEAGGVLPPQPAEQRSSGIYGYVPGELIVNFAEAVNVKQSLPGAAIAQAVQTGIASLDALSTKFGVYKMEKLFPGSSPPPLGSPYADLSRYYILSFPENVSLDEISQAYSHDSNVLTAEKDAITAVDISTPNDPRYLAGDQWPINYVADFDMDLLDAWDYERGDSAIILGIIDTGILRNHNDLGGTFDEDYTDGNVWINWAEYDGTNGVDDDANGYMDDWWGWDFVSACGEFPCWPGEDGSLPDNDPSDFNGHGTHVSGIAAAMTNNAKGIAGVAGGWYNGQHGCKVMALRIGHSSNDGGVERGFVQSNKVGPAIEYARQKGVTAINMSFGIAPNVPSIVDAVKNALLDGMIVVHSAGNSNDQIFSVIDTLTVNGTTNRVISVAATNKNGFKSGFSTYGTWVDVSAPGEDVWSSYSNHYTPSYELLSGTSMSAPHVVGLAGLMKSNFPDADGEMIREWILSTAKNIDSINDPLYAGKLGTGLINAKNFFTTVPVAGFGYSTPTRGHVPYGVSLTDSSLGTIDSLFWEFGDGATSTDTNPSHIYTTPGFYTVKQHAWSDSFGALYGISAVERKDNLYFVIADSIYFGPGHGKAGENRIPVPIYYRNHYPVTDFKVPLKFSGIDSLKCDLVNFNGSRIAGFLIKSFSIDDTAQTVLIQASGISALSPGAGLLATAYFTLGNSVPVGDTASFDSAIVDGNSLEVVSTDPQAGTYDPKLVGGFLASEPWPRGDVNKGGSLTLADVITLVNHILKGAPAPNPFWLGDFNVDGNITLIDLIAMVNRVLRGT